MIVAHKTTGELEAGVSGARDDAQLHCDSKTNLAASDHV